MKTFQIFFYLVFYIVGLLTGYFVYENNFDKLYTCVDLQYQEKIIWYNLNFDKVEDERIVCGTYQRNIFVLNKKQK